MRYYVYYLVTRYYGKRYVHVSETLDEALRFAAEYVPNVGSLAVIVDERGGSYGYEEIAAWRANHPTERATTPKQVQTFDGHEWEVDALIERVYYYAD